MQKGRILISDGSPVFTNTLFVHMKNSIVFLPIFKRILKNGLGIGLILKTNVNSRRDAMIASPLGLGVFTIETQSLRLYELMTKIFTAR